MAQSERNRETIVAQATPAGRGGIAILRVSGPNSRAIAEQILERPPKARHAAYQAFLDRDGHPLDRGIALFFSGPNSYTGEDVLELHCHGGPVVVDLLSREILHLGARHARPGEFSERAFLNGKLDLVQAEAIADLINSSSEQAARSALNSLEGEFSALIQALVESLIQLRMYVESSIDFPEEEIDFLAETEVGSRLHEILAQVQQLHLKANEGAALNEGIRVVILGKPNAGKSSLLNALAQRESAIVTDIPGTTRDLLRENIQIDGIPVHIMDTAGLRGSGDAIEQEGIRRALTETDKADRILVVTAQPKLKDKTVYQLLNNFLPDSQVHTRISLIQNKIDVHGLSPAIVAPDTDCSYPIIRLSAKTGDGINLLRQHLKEVIGFEHKPEGAFVARRRHLDALTRAEQFLRKGHAQLESRAGELLAEDLREAQQCLAEITGIFTSDDLLGRIFADFCIGK